MSDRESSLQLPISDGGDGESGGGSAACPTWTALPWNGRTDGFEALSESLTAAWRSGTVSVELRRPLPLEALRKTSAVSSVSNSPSIRRMTIRRRRSEQKKAGSTRGPIIAWNQHCRPTPHDNRASWQRSDLVQSDKRPWNVVVRVKFGDHWIAQHEAEALGQRLSLRPTEKAAQLVCVLGLAVQFPV